MENRRKKLVDRPSLDKFLHHLYFHHLYREPLGGYGKVRDTHSHTFPYGPFTRDRVEVSEHHLISPVVFSE